MTERIITTPAARERWAHLTDEVVRTHAELALFLGGSEDSFTGLLLNLFAKADMGNTVRLAGAFEREYSVWLLWRNLDPAPTFGQLQVLSDILKR